MRDEREALFQSLRDEALFELGRGNSMISSVRSARLSREKADAILDYIALLETDQRHPHADNQHYARLLGTYPDLKPHRGDDE